MRNKYLEVETMNNIDGEEPWNYRSYDDDDEDLELNDGDEDERPFAPPVFRDPDDKHKMKRLVGNY